jgi:hypothetical protein
MVKQVIETAIKQGWQYLESVSENGFFPCYISHDRDMKEGKLSPRESFSAILINEILLKDHPDKKLTRESLDYIERQSKQIQFTFFENPDIYPPDAETNALGYSALVESDRIKSDTANGVLDHLLRFRNKRGVVQVWLSDNRKPNPIDNVVATNVLYFAHLLGRGDELIATEDYIFETLNSEEYLRGSRYYHSPDSFLYFVGRLINRFPALRPRFYDRLYSAVQKRVGKTESPLDLAMRISLLREPNQEEIIKLLQLQTRGGSWPIDSLFHYGTKQGYFGSEAITTAFSLKSLESI